MKKSLLAISLAALSFIGCAGGNRTRADLQIAVEENYVEYFTLLANRFAAEHDITINVVNTNMFTVLESLPVQRGNSADLFMIVNDRIGLLADQHLIADIGFDLVGYTNNAREAGRHQGRYFYVPMSTDTTLLIYNTANVYQRPAYLSELNASEWAAVFTDFYHAAGMLSTKGGYIFGPNNNLGLNNAGSIEAGGLIQSLYLSGNNHWSAMQDSTVAYDVMMNSFRSGSINFMINGPWALADIIAMGITPGIMPIPSWDGSHPYRPLVGTKGIAVNAYSQNLDLAREFLRFLASTEHAQLWYEMTEEVAPHTGVVYAEGSVAQIIFDATSTGQSMPNNAEFFQVWAPMATALTQIANNQNVEQALMAAVTTIERNIADLN